MDRDTSEMAMQVLFSVMYAMITLYYSNNK